MYLDAKGQPIVDLSLVGPLAAGVPGTVRGMADAHARFGKLSWARDLAPAIRLARAGFVVTPSGAKERADAAPAFKAQNFDRYYGALKAGARFRQPELAATLELIAKDGAKGFYEGRTADLIVAQMDRGPGKGLITHADLAGYKTAWRAPVEGEWRGFHVITAPPPSSGGIALLQLLGMKANDAALFKGVELNSPQYLHLVSEIEKRVFADRAEYLGDPDFWKVPVTALTDPAYVARRAREVDPAKPSPTAAVKPGLQKGVGEAADHPCLDRRPSGANAVSNTYTFNWLVRGGRSWSRARASR